MSETSDKKIKYSNTGLTFYHLNPDADGECGSMFMWETPVIGWDSDGLPVVADDWGDLAVAAGTYSESVSTVSAVAFGYAGGELITVSNDKLREMVKVHCLHNPDGGLTLERVTGEPADGTGNAFERLIFRIYTRVRDIAATGPRSRQTAQPAEIAK